MTQHLYRRWLASLATVLFVVSLALPAFSTPEAAPLHAGTDVSNLTLGAGSQGARGPVRFSHDRHTLSVTDCAVCHSNLTTGTTPFAFVPQSGTQKGVSRQDLMHRSCITCHEAQQRGPLQAQCADCHTTPPASALFTPRFDRSLHARHIVSPFVVDPAAPESPVRGKNCAVCHHSIQQSAVQEEGHPNATPAGTAPLRESCRTCHAAGDGTSTEPAAATPSFRTVGHETCVVCHQTTRNAGKVGGPVQCAGCHDAATFAGYQRLNPVPPLQAGQPVAVNLHSTEKPSMPVVPFNHRLHENSLPSCASCHHKTVQACSACHAPAGKDGAKGGSVSLSAAMHNAQAANSCVGCHAQRQLSQPDCAGCHALRQTGSVAGNCAFCHRPAVPLTPVEPAVPVAVPLAVTAAVPLALSSAPAYPEMVSIGRLSNEFQPSQFPHGRIVRALQRGISAAEPSLALRHDSTALCAACHHKAPVSAPPPACVTCHLPVAGLARQNTPPSLRLAYHQQCMGCHERMHISTPVNTDCAGCHAPVERRADKPSRRLKCLR